MIGLAWVYATFRPTNTEFGNLIAVLTYHLSI